MSKIAHLGCHLLLWIVVLLKSAAFAGVPATLNYQGTLADSAGQPVNGSKAITFKLYKTPTGQTAFWSEAQPSVELRDGRFSVVLGANAANPIKPQDFTGETYIGIQVAPDAEMPRQKFTSVAYAFTASNAPAAIPKGVIVMWSGALTAIPSGWALCDGNNGTPDLRDRFVVGAGSGYVIGNTGGAASVNISHSHSIAAQSPGTSSAGDHLHSFSGDTSETKGETHSVTDDGSNDREVAGDNHSHSYSGTTSAAGGHTHTVNSHDHGGATGSAGSTALENRPPYYALAFIIKL